jgi:hypothetical protein
MPSDTPITLRFEGAGEVPVESPAEGLTVSVPVTRVGDRLYRQELSRLTEQGYRRFQDSGLA